MWRNRCSRADPPVAQRQQAMTEVIGASLTARAAHFFSGHTHSARHLAGQIVETGASGPELAHQVQKWTDQVDRLSVVPW